MTNKEAGVVWEYKFFSRVLDLGHKLYIPAGDNLATDCVIAKRGDGGLVRVQVKGTTRINKKLSGLPRYQIIAGSGSKSKTPIDCSEVDLLSVYIAPEDTWYLIPCPALNGKKSLWFYPNSADSKARFEQYKEAWDILS